MRREGGRGEGRKECGERGERGKVGRWEKGIRTWKGWQREGNSKKVEWSVEETKALCQAGKKRRKKKGGKNEEAG